MNGLDTFEALRPDTDHLDAATATRIRQRIVKSHPELDSRGDYHEAADLNASTLTLSEKTSDEPVRIAGPRRADRRRSVVLVAAAVAALGVAGLAGLATRSGPATTPADRPPVPADTVLDPVSTVDGETVLAPTVHLSPDDLFVAAALSPDPVEVERYDRAVATHRATCMAEAGFNEVPELAPLAPTTDIYTPMVDFLYFDDAARIAAYGYFWPNRFGPPVGTNEQQPTVTPEMSAALDRCNQPVIAIQQQAYRANDLVGVVPEVIDGQIFDAVSARPEVEATYVEWKQCMSNAGYPTARLREPITDNDVETIDQAATDASCRTTTGYTRAIVAAQADEVANWLASNREEVEAFKRLYTELADGAAQLN